MKKTLLVILLVGVFLVAACTTTTPPSSNGGTGNQQPDTGMDDQPNTKDNTPTAKVVEIDMIAKQWVFEPDTVTVNEGDTVKLNVESIDVAHGIGINAFGIRERLEPGKTVNIEFVADKKGTFSFFCTIFCGSGHSGMKGTLIVK